MKETRPTKRSGVKQREADMPLEKSPDFAAGYVTGYNAAFKEFYNKLCEFESVIIRNFFPHAAIYVTNQIKSFVAGCSQKGGLR